MRLTTLNDGLIGGPPITQSAVSATVGPVQVTVSTAIGTEDTFPVIVGPTKVSIGTLATEAPTESVGAEKVAVGLTATETSLANVLVGVTPVTVTAIQPSSDAQGDEVVGAVPVSVSTISPTESLSETVGPQQAAVTAISPSAVTLAAESVGAAGVSVTTTTPTLGIAVTVGPQSVSVSHGIGGVGIGATIGPLRVPVSTQIIAEWVLLDRSFRRAGYTQARVVQSHNEVNRAMSDFWIRQGDTAPQLEVVCEDDVGNAQDLTGATAVAFHMTDKQYTELVNASGSLKDAANGVVVYAWSDGDTDTAGEHYGEFQVTHTDGSVETFPNRGYIRIRVERELA